MILTDYYRFERMAETKAKQRMDCTASTRSYATFEGARATKAKRATEKRDAIALNSLTVYLGGTPEHFGNARSRKADLILTLKGNNLSSIYVPNMGSGLGYGDTKDDALLFVLTDVSMPNGVVSAGAVVEVFVARGRRTDRLTLYTLFDDGELDDEMNALRKSAQPEPPDADGSDEAVTDAGRE